MSQKLNFYFVTLKRHFLAQNGGGYDHRSVKITLKVSLKVRANKPKGESARHRGEQARG